MRPAPLDIGTIHFVGVGGIGMSGIAEVMHNLGYSVQGSDMAESANVKRLRELGVDVMVGQKAENLKDAHVVVISSAIQPDNPELKEARDLAGRLHPRCSGPRSDGHQWRHHQCLWHQCASGRWRVDGCGGR